jgi:hypothetical protein
MEQLLRWLHAAASWYVFSAVAPEHHLSTTCSNVTNAGNDLSILTTCTYRLRNSASMPNRPTMKDNTDNTVAVTATEIMHSNRHSGPVGHNSFGGPWHDCSTAARQKRRASSFVKLYPAQHPVHKSGHPPDTNGLDWKRQYHEMPTAEEGKCCAVAN